MFRGGVREGMVVVATFDALAQLQASPQWRRGEKAFAPAGEELCRTGRTVRTGRQRACTA